MNTGLLFALLSAVVFAVGIVMVRRSAGAAGEAFTVTAMSIFAGIPLFVIVLTFNDGWASFRLLTVNTAIMLVSAGIIHFVIGRLMAYDAFRLIGANRATPITQLSPVYTVLLSWLFISENLTAYVIFGAALMMGGVVLISQEKSAPKEGERVPRREEIKGILLSLGASVCWGITPVLVKPAVGVVGSAVMGNFITYTSAGIVMGLLTLNHNNREHFKRLSFRKNVIPMAIAGLVTAAGQLLYFVALLKSPANIVAPLVSIEVLFIYIISYFVSRRHEVFTYKIALGMAAMIAGTFLLFR